MPNWCNQIVTITGADLTSLDKLFSGKLENKYDHAVHLSTQFFIAGYLGLLKPVVKIYFKPHPKLTKKTGKRTKENTAYTHWLGFLMADVDITEKYADQIIKLAEEVDFDKLFKGISTDTPLGKKVTKLYNIWEGTDELQTLISKWEDVDRTPSNGRHALGMLSILPISLLSELQGFNQIKDPFLNTPTSYSEYSNRLGSKWPVVWTDKYELTYSKEDPDKVIKIITTFKSAWSPLEPVMRELSLSYNAEVEMQYVEQGMDFCGRSHYFSGMTLNEEMGQLNFEYADDEETFTINPPDWLMKFDDYGG